VTGSVKLPAGVEMVMPGDNAEVEVELITTVAMEKGLRLPSGKAAGQSAPEP